MTFEPAKAWTHDGDRILFCPFCHRPPKGPKQLKEHDGDWSIFCDWVVCKAQPMVWGAAMDTKEKALDAWNDREAK